MTATPFPIAPRSASGLLNPVFSSLQLRALRTAFAFGTVFFLGLGLIVTQIYSLLPAEMRGAILELAGVRTVLLIAALWLFCALIPSPCRMLAFFRWRLSG